LFIFGGSSTKGFCFALIVGIVIGTYSSIFVATPVIVDLGKNLKMSTKRVSEKLGKKVAKV
jgi:SecD/SecF fusion protein